MNHEENLLCLKYSVPVFLISLAASISFLTLHYPLNFSWVNLFLTYLIASISSAIAIFGYRAAKKGLKNTAKTEELSIVGLSAGGMSLPLALIGVLLAFSKRGEYQGAEKWLPEIENPEKEIQRLISELSLSEATLEHSMDLLEKLNNYNLLSGRPASEMSAAIVYIASKEENEPRTLEEISTVARASRKQIGRAYRFIGRNTEIEIFPPAPEDHLERFVEKMDLSEDTENRARKMVEEASKTNIISGKSPKSIAASALYLASYLENEKRTMNDMSRTLGITTITIRNRSKDLIETLDIEEYPEHLEN